MKKINSNYVVHKKDLIQVEDDKLRNLKLSGRGLVEQSVILLAAIKLAQLVERGQVNIVRGLRQRAYTFETQNHQQVDR